MLLKLALWILAVTALPDHRPKEWGRNAGKMCTARKKIKGKWQNIKNPIFGGVWWKKGKLMRIWECMMACENNKDAKGRRCLAIKVGTKAFKFDTRAKCALIWGCKFLRNSGGTVYMRPTGPLPTEPPTAAPTKHVCDPVNTEAVLDVLGPAAENLAACHARVEEIKDMLESIAATTDQVKENAILVDESMEDIEDVVKRAETYSKVLGTIPKVGVLIKIGMKAARIMVDKLEDVSELMRKHITRIDAVAQFLAAAFINMEEVLGPSSRFLTKNHEAVLAGKECMEVLGCQKGTIRGRMERVNGEEYDKIAPPLEATALGGETCVAVLSPMIPDLGIMEAIAKAIRRLMKPINKIIAKVAEFVAEMNRLIDEFIAYINSQPEVQCARDFINPLVDLADLIMCPISEVEAATMHFVVNRIMKLIAELVDRIVKEGIDQAVNAIVPDGLEIEVPDFKELLPYDMWWFICIANQVYWPARGNQLQNLLSLDLPQTFTSEDIRSSILEQAMAATDVSFEKTTYKSACLEAWNELGTDLSVCWQVMDAYEAALIAEAERLEREARAAAQAVKDEAVRLAREALEAAELAYDEAEDHLTDLQKDADDLWDDTTSAEEALDAARDAVDAAKGQLSKAEKQLKEAKKSCPNCSYSCPPDPWNCGLECAAETAWCCPLEVACNTSIDTANLAISSANTGVREAESAVGPALTAYNDAYDLWETAAGKVTTQEGVVETKDEAVEEAQRYYEEQLALPLVYRRRAPETLALSAATDIEK